MGYIFEAEIEAIMTAVRARTIGEEDGITLRTILKSDIHPAIKAYFRAEVEKLLEQERAREQRSRRFPYSHPEVLSLQQQIDRLLILHYHFARHEFETVLDQSVHFQFNYLCRPQFTLLSYILGNQRHVAAVEIERKLRSCVDYRYFPELIKRYVNERGLVDLTFEEFKSLLERIDGEVVAQHSSIELARMMRPIFLFVDESRLQPHDEFDQPLLPTNAAIVFFEDKKMAELKERLESERDKNGLALLSVRQLAEIIEKVRTGREDSVIPDSEEQVPPPEQPPAVSDEPPATAGAEAVPTEDELQPAPKPDVDASTQETAPADAVSFPGGLADVRTLFTDAEKKKFLKTVFKKDEHAFEMTIDELNHIESWQETSLFLDSLFVSLGVDPFSEPAVHFTDRLYTRYFPDQGAGA
jgi:hypothetical protein